MDGGYIKLFRGFLEWEWYSDINTSRLFIHFLLKCNYETKKWQGIDIKRGSFITSLENLHNDTGLSVRSIRTSIDKLKSTNDITCISTSHYSTITVIKYDLYQNAVLKNDKPTTSKTTNERQTNDKPTTTTKEIKKLRNVFIPPSAEQIKKYAFEIDKKINAQDFIDFYQAKGWKIGINKMTDWKASVRKWKQNDIQPSVKNSIRIDNIKTPGQREYVPRVPAV